MLIAKGEFILLKLYNRYIKLKIKNVFIILIVIKLFKLQKNWLSFEHFLITRKTPEPNQEIPRDIKVCLLNFASNELIYYLL